MRNFDRRDRLLPRSNAIEPVAVVLLAVVEMYFVWPDDRLDNLWIACLERFRVLQLRHWIARGHCLVATRHEDPPVRPYETDPVRKIAADDHVDAVGVHRL